MNHFQKSMSRKRRSKRKKTMYCIHAHNCDRPENCLDGESCAFMEVEEKYIPPDDNCEHWMDKIWEGKQQGVGYPTVAKSG